MVFSFLCGNRLRLYSDIAASQPASELAAQQKPVSRTPAFAPLIPSTLGRRRDEDPSRGKPLHCTVPLRAFLTLRSVTQLYAEVGSLRPSLLNRFISYLAVLRLLFAFGEALPRCSALHCIALVRFDHSLLSLVPRASPAVNWSS